MISGNWYRREMMVESVPASLSFLHTTSARFLGKGITDNVLQPPNLTSSQETSSNHQRQRKKLINIVRKSGTKMRTILNPI